MGHRNVRKYSLSQRVVEKWNHLDKAVIEPDSMRRSRVNTIRSKGSKYTGRRSQRRSQRRPSPKPCLNTSNKQGLAYPNVTQWRWGNSYHPILVLTHALGTNHVEYCIEDGHSYQQDIASTRALTQPSLANIARGRQPRNVLTSAHQCGTKSIMIASWAPLNQ